MEKGIVTKTFKVLMAAAVFLLSFHAPSTLADDQYQRKASKAVKILREHARDFGSRLAYEDFFAAMAEIATERDITLNIMDPYFELRNLLQDAKSYASNDTSISRTDLQDRFLKLQAQYSDLLAKRMDLQWGMQRILLDFEEVFEMLNVFKQNYARKCEVGRSGFGVNLESAKMEPLPPRVAEILVNQDGSVDRMTNYYYGKSKGHQDLDTALIYSGMATGLLLSMIAAIEVGATAGASAATVATIGSTAAWAPYLAIVILVVTVISIEAAEQGNIREQGKANRAVDYLFAKSPGDDAVAASYRNSCKKYEAITSELIDSMIAIKNSDQGIAGFVANNVDNEKAHARYSLFENDAAQLRKTRICISLAESNDFSCKQLEIYQKGTIALACEERPKSHFEISVANTEGSKEQLCNIPVITFKDKTAVNDAGEVFTQKVPNPDNRKKYLRELSFQVEQFNQKYPASVVIGLIKEISLIYLGQSESAIKSLASSIDFGSIDSNLQAVMGDIEFLLGVIWSDAELSFGDFTFDETVSQELADLKRGISDYATLILSAISNGDKVSDADRIRWKEFYEKSKSFLKQYSYDLEFYKLLQNVEFLNGKYRKFH